MAKPIIDAVLVAAGQSQRMGSVNKLSLPVGQEPLVRRCARALTNSCVRDVTVVIGHDASTVADALAGLPLRTILHNGYASGQASSVSVGLANLREDSEAFMVCLADMPLLTSEDFNWLANAFAQQCSRPILIPFYQQRRGNPAVIATPLRDRILANGRVPSCRRFIDDHPALVQRIETPNDHFIRDVDTPADYRALVGERSSP